jgi:hypothetical protein
MLGVVGTLGVFGVLGLSACAARERAPNPADLSGFLDDYSRLRTGGPDEASLVYRDPKAHWGAYDKLLFEPVTVWRSGKGSLDDVPEEDLKRLAAVFQHSVRVRLEESFRIVDRPSPGTLRVRLGLTQARQTDPVLDVFTFDVPPTMAVAADEPLVPPTQALVSAVSVEGQLTDAVTNAVLAEGIDRRRTHTLRSWGDVRAAADRWAAWFAGRIQRARRDEPRR